MRRVLYRHLLTARLHHRTCRSYQPRRCTRAAPRSCAPSFVDVLERAAEILDRRAHAGDDKNFALRGRVPSWGGLHASITSLGKVQP